MSFLKWGRSNRSASPKSRERSNSAGTESSRNSKKSQPTSPLMSTNSASLLQQSSDNHQLVNPLNWDTTPNYLKKQFPHWKNTATSPPADVKGEGSAADDGLKEEKLNRNSLKQPANTAIYSVKLLDTLSSIALQFSTTPSHLRQLNRLATRTMCPGQILYVPDEDPQQSATPPRVRAAGTGDEDSGSHKSDLHSSSSASDEIASTHIRIRAKYITKDQGCCKGMLLLTSASIMFKPNENDPLVIEHGQSPFGVILSMNDITFASVVSDFAKLVEHSPRLNRRKGDEDIPAEGERKDDATNKDRTLSSTQQNTDSGPSTDSNHTTTKPDRSDLTITLPPDQDNDVLLSKKPPTPGHAVRVGQGLPPHVTTEPPTPPPPASASSTDEMLAIMGANVTLTTAEGAPQESVDLSFQKLLSDPEAMTFSCRVEEEKRPEQQQQQQVARGPLPQAPQFLRIRVASHAYHTFVPTVGVDIPQGRGQGTRVMVHTKTEFWFAFPSERLAELISFFLTTHLPPLGDTGVVHHQWNNGVFVLINEQANSSGSSTGEGLNDNYYSNTSSSWEVYSLSDVQSFRDKILKMEVENDLPLPTLDEKSDLMLPYHIQQLSKNLISTAVGHDWVLLYSTFKHGMSLQTLYRNMMDYGDNPVLLFLRDKQLQVFGAMLTCHVRQSEHYYGTGESFLFKFEPNKESVLELKIFRWTGINDFVVKGNTDSFVLGGGHDGKFGLWLDDQFYHGASYMCKTFDNEILSTTSDFICTGLEAWGFV